MTPWFGIAYRGNHDCLGGAPLPEVVERGVNLMALTCDDVYSHPLKAILLSSNFQEPRVNLDSDLVKHQHIVRADIHTYLNNGTSQEWRM